MDQSSKKDIKASYLPALYRSPWSSLRSDLRAVFSDLILKVREIWRRNREEDLPYPKLWPKRHAKFFWPFLVCLPILLFVSGIFFSRFSLEHLPSKFDLGQQDSVEEIDVRSEEKLLLLSDEKSPSGLALEDSVVQINNQLDKSKLNLSVDLKTLSLKDVPSLSEIPKELQQLFEKDVLDNGVILRVSHDWFDLTTDERLDVSNHLNALLEDIGYAEFQIKDLGDKTLARSSRVGNGMIVFEKGVG